MGLGKTLQCISVLVYMKVPFFFSLGIGIDVILVVNEGEVLPRRVMG